MIKDNIVYLTTNQVIAINTVHIHLYSPLEPAGVKDPSLLDFAINRPIHQHLEMMHIQLFMNKWTMGIEEEQDFIVDVVNHKYTFEKIVSIIKEQTIKI